jgi:hypothetical protein
MAAPVGPPIFTVNGRKHPGESATRDFPHRKSKFENRKFSVKSLVVLLSAAAASASVLALAQSAGPATAINTTPAISSPSPTATPSPANTGPAASSVPLPGMPTGPTLEKNLPLIPETAPSSHRGKGGKPGKTGRSGPNASPGASPHDTFGVESDIRLRIHIREAQTRAANDPSVQADWVAAHNTRTDPERREALKVYYNHLYDKMIKIDPSIATLANARRQGSIDRMYYARLGDEVPDNPFATPTPPAEGKNPPAPDEPPLP